MDRVDRVRVLITVKTYPVPSKKYGEVVCTAGVREDGSWIRLYPIDYRHRDYSQWYRKYQWIEVDVEKHPQDPRPESFRPLGEIKISGKPIGTEDGWGERKKYVLASGVKDMCWLNQQKQSTISISVIKPKEVQDFCWEKDRDEWSDDEKAVLNQMALFDKDSSKPLEKIPYKFYYRFTCGGSSCCGHKMMIEDWEVMELYRKMRDKYGVEDALKKVKERFLDYICSSEKETYFFVGTVLQYGTWIILGTFWPPKGKGKY